MEEDFAWAELCYCVLAYGGADCFLFVFCGADEVVGAEGDFAAWGFVGYGYVAEVVEAAGFGVAVVEFVCE